MERHPAGCDPEAFRRLPAPPSRRPPRASSSTAIPRAPSRNIPRHPRPPRPRPRLSASLEEAIVSVCNLSPTVNSGFPAVVEFRKQMLELENRFIAHVVAELKAFRMHMRPKEETRKRRRSADSDYRPERDGHTSGRMLNKPRRASVGEVLMVASTGKQGRANAGGVSREMLDEGGIEVEPVRGRFPRRSKQAVVNLDDDQLDAEFAPEVLDGLIEAREPRRSGVESSRGIPSQVAPNGATIHNVDDSDLSVNDDSDETDDSETEVLLPVVRPKPMVRERTLCSDHMSLTPIITDDDEGTDTEERRRVLARRPIKTRKLAEEESISAFSVLPRSRHRLRVDYMVLFPGAEEKLRLPKPKPPKLTQPGGPRSQVRLYPLVDLIDIPKTPQRVDLRFHRIAPRPVQQQRISSLQSNPKPAFVEGVLPKNAQGKRQAGSVDMSSVGEKGFDLEEALPKKAQGKRQAGSVDMSSVAGTGLDLEGALPKKAQGKRRAGSVDMSNVAGNGLDHRHGLTYRGVPPSSSAQAPSVLPIGQVSAPRKETTISKKPVPTQTATAASKPTLSWANVCARSVSARHRPMSEGTNTQAPQAGPSHSQSLLEWKSQPRDSRARAPQPHSLLAWKSQPRTYQAGSSPATMSPSEMAPPVRIRSPEAPASRIPTPNSVDSRRSLPGTTTVSKGTTDFPASSPNVGSGNNKKPCAGHGFPTTDAGASVRGNDVLSNEQGLMKNILHGRASMDPDASQSASSTALKQVGEAMQSGETAMVTGNGQAHSNATAIPNGDVRMSHSAGATDILHMTSSSNGHMSEEEMQRYQRILEKRTLGQMIREETLNHMRRTQQLQEWSSTAVRPGAVVPPLDSSMVPQNNELVVRNSAMVPHGLPYSLVQSQTTPSGYGVPAQFAVPSGPAPKMPSQMTVMPANRTGGVPLPYAGAVINGSMQGNLNPSVSPYPSGAGGAVLVHPYQMSPDTLSQLMASLNSSQRSSMPGQSGDRNVHPPFPQNLLKRYNESYKQAYLEFEKERKDEDGEQYPGER